MSETRKLAAILVTDVVGCSSLMSEDEVGAAPMGASQDGAAARPRFGLRRSPGDGILCHLPAS